MLIPILLAIGGIVVTYMVFRPQIEKTVQDILTPAPLTLQPTAQTPPAGTQTPIPTILPPPPTTTVDCGPITGPNFRCCICKTRACPGKQGCCEPCRAVCLADCTNPATMV